MAGERAYKNATEFRPERWYDNPEMVKESTAWAPFSLGLCPRFLIPGRRKHIGPGTTVTDSAVGTYNCIGKPLALMTLRTTVAKIIRRFDIGFAEGDDGKACEKQRKT